MSVFILGAGGSGSGGGGGGSGNVSCNSGSTNNGVPRFVGSDGHLIQNSDVTITDGGELEANIVTSRTTMEIGLGNVAGEVNIYSFDTLSKFRLDCDDSKTGGIITNLHAPSQETNVTFNLPVLAHGVTAATLAIEGGGGTGDVVGPASSNVNAIATYADGTGKLLANTLVNIDSSGNVIFPSGRMNANGVLEAGKDGDNGRITIYPSNSNSGTAQISVENSSAGVVSQLVFQAQTNDVNFLLPIVPGGGNVTLAIAGGGGSGDVVGPASSTNTAIVRYDGTTGKLIKNSTATLADDGIIVTNGFQGITVRADSVTGINTVDVGEEGKAGTLTIWPATALNGKVQFNVDNSTLDDATQTVHFQPQEQDVTFNFPIIPLGSPTNVTLLTNADIASSDINPSPLQTLCVKNSGAGNFNYANGLYGNIELTINGDGVFNVGYDINLPISSKVVRFDIVYQVGGTSYTSLTQDFTQTNYSAGVSPVINSRTLSAVTAFSSTPTATPSIATYDITDSTNSISNQKQNWDLELTLPSGCTFTLIGMTFYYDR